MSTGHFGLIFPWVTTFFILFSVLFVLLTVISMTYRPFCVEFEEHSPFEFAKSLNVVKMDDFVFFSVLDPLEFKWSRMLASG